MDLALNNLKGWYAIKPNQPNIQPFEIYIISNIKKSRCFRVIVLYIQDRAA